MDISVYSRPNKPDTLIVTKRSGLLNLPSLALPETISVDKDTECHVTPKSVATRMVSYLGDQDGAVLEPQCGTGNLIKALLEGGYSQASITGVERHIGLHNSTFERFKGNDSVNLINQCFLQFAQENTGRLQYANIVMNPPFSKVKAHMKAALSLLGRNDSEQSVLVALVPVTYQHEDAEELERLPDDTFQNAKVNTKIIRFVY